MKSFNRGALIARIVCVAVFCGLGVISAAAQEPIATPPPVVVRSANPTKLRQETFELVWQTVNRTFYDPKFNGVDWQAVHDRYAPRVAAARSDAELYSLLQLMVNELHQSHFWVIAPEAIPKLRPKPRGNRSKEADEPIDEGDESADEPAAETALDLIKESLADRLSTGIGIDVRVVDGTVLITRVDSGSAAARAGLRPGFVVKSIDGKPLAQALAELEANPVLRDIIRPEIPLVLIAKYMNGNLNDSIELTYANGRNVLRRVRLVREKLRGEMSEPVGNLPSLYTDFEAKRLAGGFGYIRFNAFVPNLMKKVCAALREMHDARGIILDLRGNQGGLLGMSAGLAGLVNDYSSMFGAMKTRSGRVPVIVMPQRKAYSGPLAILVDGSTLSAAEIFASGLQQEKRALVVGDITAGNALPSAVIKLPTGGLFQYAFGTYESADGEVLEGRGVVPDWIVKITRRNLLRSGDPQLAAAIVRLRARISSSISNEFVVDVTSAAPQKAGPKAVVTADPPPPAKPIAAPVSGKTDPDPAMEENARIVHQVLDHYLDALGGEAALLKVHSRVSTGTVELPQGLKGTVEIYEEEPNRSSVFMNLKGFGVLQQTFDGKVRWLQDPVRGYLRISDGGSSDDSFHNDVELRRNAKSLRFERKEKVGSVECFVLTRSVAGRIIERLYFSGDSGLLVRENDLYYEDYRDVNGLKIPFVARSGDSAGGLGTVIRLKEVKNNVPIDDGKFAERPDCFTRPDQVSNVKP